MKSLPFTQIIAAQQTGKSTVDIWSCTENMVYLQFNRLENIRHRYFLEVFLNNN
ncbi:hypothetical protein HMPREF9419_1912 [Prevotella nigrescens ATCC 33563]|nr:hypothetical protein HMPREF9419_1912 [Prevotella nigrescens ATCC 33563]